MKRRTQSAESSIESLRRLALGYPETTENVVCSRASFKARGKAFLFVGGDESSHDAMVKLNDSLEEAAGLAGCKVGAHGWVTVRWSRDESPPKVLAKWIDESFHLLAPKQVVALALTLNSKTPAKSKKRRMSTGDSR
jgi:hypothetical protein